MFTFPFFSNISFSPPFLDGQYRGKLMITTLHACLVICSACMPTDNLPHDPHPEWYNNFTPPPFWAPPIPLSTLLVVSPNLSVQFRGPSYNENVPPFPHWTLAPLLCNHSLPWFKLFYNLFSGHLLIPRLRFPPDVY